MSYFRNIGTAFSSLWQGFSLTLRHLAQARSRRKVISVKEEDYFAEKENKGRFTVQYPFEGLPVPVNGRYKLHNEIDDCIVCDKCAKVCPVNCIEIVPIRSADTIGITSDGTPKRIHAAKFDIDMAKCCFCGLCTTVCPTECLTMTDDYDFSVTDIAEHNFKFGKMSGSEISTAEQLWEEAQSAKAAAKAATETLEKRPAARPKVIMPKPKTGGPASAKPKAIMPKAKPTAAKPAAKPKVIMPKPKPKKGPDGDSPEEKD